MKFPLVRAVLGVLFLAAAMIVGQFRMNQLDTSSEGSLLHLFSDMSQKVGYMENELTNAHAAELLSQEKTIGFSVQPGRERQQDIFLLGSRYALVPVGVELSQGHRFRLVGGIPFRLERDRE